jgi:hypothetical protein
MHIKPKGKRLLEGPSRSCILISLKEVGCEGVDWIHLAQDRIQWRAVVNTVMKLRVS